MQVVEGFEVLESKRRGAENPTGASLSAASRSRDLDVDRILAERSLEELHRWFIVPAISTS